MRRLIYLCACMVFANAIALAQHAYQLSGDVWGVHDPSIIKEGDTWYLFATGKAPGGGQIPIRCSNDLEHWRLCGQVFDRIPEWVRNDSPGARDLWAPDISFYKGEYRLYYAYSPAPTSTKTVNPWWRAADRKLMDPKCVNVNNTM